MVYRIVIQILILAYHNPYILFGLYIIPYMQQILRVFVIAGGKSDDTVDGRNPAPPKMYKTRRK